MVETNPDRNRCQGNKNAIAIFGGTFDPPHNGHLGIASGVLESGMAAKIIFVPAFHPPHKPDSPVTDFALRLEMLRLAVETYGKFEVSDIERRRSGPSYTFDTLVEMEERNAGSAISLLIGSDSLAQLHTWYKAREIVGRWPMIVYPRPGIVPDYTELEANWGAEVAERLLGYILPMKYHDVSSTMIRNRISQGGRVEGLVPAPVLGFIYEKGLYSQKI